MLMIKKILIITFFVISLTGKSHSFSVIRDGEVEEFLQELTLPIIQKSGLESKNIKIYIVNDPAVNAFVSSGQNIFINTGLITKYTDPNVLRGVLAHEIGHIASGHLARGSEEIKKAQNIMMLTYLAGIISAAASSSDAGYAMLMGGNQVAERLFLKYNRSQEEAADILALEYLRKTNNNPLGLLKILEFFKSQAVGQEIFDEYALTHPISQQRINFIKANLDHFPASNHDSISIEQNFKTQRIVAKLRGFLDDVDTTINETEGKNNFLNLYRRSIALFKSGQTKSSLQVLDELLAKNPKDAYLLELKGQFLYESGDIKNSIIFYKKSLDVNGNNFLARIIFAKSILDLDSNNSDLIQIAIDNLKMVLLKEKDNLQIYQILSESYKKINDEAMANLSLAEYYLLKNDSKNATEYAKKAKKLFNKNNKRGLLRVNDIIEISKNIDTQP
ncbi:MAG: putative Zn-dependent protease [Rickettsiales bacterium]|jgi:predicted Zn-dependent protease